MTTTTAKMPYLPNHRWQKQAKNRLQYVAKEINGEPNPSYLALEQEIAQWEQNAEDWTEFANFVFGGFGLRHLNKYAIRKNGEHHEPNTAFYGVVGGVTRWISKEEAWRAFVAQQ